MAQRTQPPTDHDRVAEEIDRLVDECRADHLWYQRADYHPGTDAERLQVLEAIQRRANLEVFRRAGALKAWLSRLSSGEVIVTGRAAPPRRRSRRGPTPAPRGPAPCSPLRVCARLPRD